MARTAFETRSTRPGKNVSKLAEDRIDLGLRHARLISVDQCIVRRQSVRGAERDGHLARQPTSSANGPSMARQSFAARAFRQICSQRVLSRLRSTTSACRQRGRLQVPAFDFAQVRALPVVEFGFFGRGRDQVGDLVRRQLPMHDAGQRREHVAAAFAAAGRHHHGFVPTEHRLRVAEVADLAKALLERA